VTEPRPDPHRITLPHPPRQALEAAAEAVEQWGGEWDRQGGAAGRVRLPVKAGLRFGFLDGELEVAAAPGGASVELRPESATWFLNTTAVVVLLLAGLGALLLILWPFFPAHETLAQIAPLGAVLALGGWFLVLSRLETRGPQELLDLVSDLAEIGPPEVGDEHGEEEMGPGGSGDVGSGEPPRAVSPR
jgi:hypothetical protein